MGPNFIPPLAGEKANDAAKAHFDFSSLPINEVPTFPEIDPGNGDHPTMPDLPQPDLPEVAGFVPDVDFPDFFIA